MEKGENWFENPMIWIGVIVVAVLFWVILPSPGEYNDFANCVSESGVVMYGTELCSHCRDQKELFGDSFVDINFVDCNKDRDECLGEGVSVYPSWKIDDEIYSGKQSLERLADLSGCELRKDK